jgi:hypothetical protein
MIDSTTLLRHRKVGLIAQRIIPLSMKEEDICKISEEELLSIKENLRTTAYQTTFNALLDLGGNESAVNSIRPYIRLCGYAFAINMIRIFGIQGEDIDKIADVCFLDQKLFDYDLKEIERSKDKVIFVGGTKCHWRDNPLTGCITGHEMLLNEVCQAINPEYECRFTQMIPKGDPFCSFIVEKKRK